MNDCLRRIAPEKNAAMLAGAEMKGELDASRVLQFVEPSVTTLYVTRFLVGGLVEAFRDRNVGDIELHRRAEREPDLVD